MGPLVLFEADLQIFLPALFVCRFDPVRDMGKGRWSESSEGRGKAKPKRYLGTPQCRPTKPRPSHTLQEHHFSPTKSDYGLDFASQGIFPVFRDICHIEGLKLGEAKAEDKRPAMSRTETISDC